MDHYPFLKVNEFTCRCLDISGEQRRMINYACNGARFRFMTFVFPYLVC